MGGCPFQIERTGRPAGFPGKDGGRQKFFRSARARSDGEAGKPWTRTVTNRRGGEPGPSVSSDRPRRACVARTKKAAAQNPDPETSGVMWKDPARDEDLSEAARPLPKNSARPNCAAAPHCARSSCNGCKEERRPARR